LARKHATIERPTEEQLLELVQGKAASIGRLYLEAHRLVLQTLPDVVYAVDCDDAVISYGVRQYGYDGWGLGALSPHTKWVNLYFMRGTDLDDPLGILEGQGKRMRHVKLRSLEELEKQRNAIGALLREASRLNSGSSTA
jgi:Uncharacterized conserved protein